MCKNRKVLQRRNSLKVLALVAALRAATDKGGRLCLPLFLGAGETPWFAADEDVGEVSGTRSRSEAAEYLSSLTTRILSLEPFVSMSYLAGGLLVLATFDIGESLQRSLSASTFVLSEGRKFGPLLTPITPSAMALCTNAPSSVVPGGSEAV